MGNQYFISVCLKSRNAAMSDQCPHIFLLEQLLKVIAARDLLVEVRSKGLSILIRHFFS